MIEKFYADNYDRLVNQMRKKLAGNLHVAEDVVQESFERALRHIESYDPDRGKFSTWFNTILYNVLKNTQKANNKSPEEAMEEISVQSVLNHNLVGSEEFSKEIRQQIYASKNLKHRDVLELFFVYGYTSKEIPYLLEGVSQSNVTTVVKRFRDKLA